ncbi:hypothetical protein ANN_04805 [Periplaneta americana]|uniref:Uncharacterized protein n=1 Tax=Periplaneta americana TaxID=6978 RepID=A0ABQ8T9F1_PERAM|nr:hypothetical protein ANN_04805 [Periplaneta americana]
MADMHAMYGRANCNVNEAKHDDDDDDVVDDDDDDEEEEEEEGEEEEKKNNDDFLHIILWSVADSIHRLADRPIDLLPRSTERSDEVWTGATGFSLCAADVLVAGNGGDGASKHVFVLARVKVNESVEGKPRKKPQPGNLSRPGFEPGPPGFAARRADRLWVDAEYFDYRSTGGPPKLLALSTGLRGLYSSDDG